MGGTSNHVKWNKPHLDKHVFSFMWHTHYESRTGTLWREKVEKEDMRRQWRIKTNAICFLSYAEKNIYVGVLCEGSKKEQWEGQRENETVMEINCTN